MFALVHSLRNIKYFLHFSDVVTCYGDQNAPSQSKISDDGNQVVLQPFSRLLAWDWKFSEKS